MEPLEGAVVLDLRGPSNTFEDRWRLVVVLVERSGTRHARPCGPPTAFEGCACLRDARSQSWAHAYQNGMLAAVTYQHWAGMLVEVGARVLLSRDARCRHSVVVLALARELIDAGVGKRPLAI